MSVQESSPGSAAIDLPQYAFVQPLNKDYVPKEAIERNKWVTVVANQTFMQGDAYYYTRYGILLLPSKLIEGVE